MNRHRMLKRAMPALILSAALIAAALASEPPEAETNLEPAHPTQVQHRRPS